MRPIEEFTRFVIEILQEEVKEGKLILEKREINEDKSEVMIDFIFDVNSCPKKMRITFDYDKFADRINRKKTTLQN